MTRTLHRARALPIAVLALLVTISVASAGMAETRDRVPKRSPERLTTDRGFREDVGLPSDISYIRALYDNPDLADPSSIAKHGALLTPQEDERMDDWSRLSAAMGEVREYARSNAATVFAGAYIDDQAEGGNAYVAFTRDAPQHFKALQRRFPYPDRLRLFSARFSEQELASVVSDVGEALSDLEAEGIDILEVSTAVERNVVEIGVANVDDDTVRRLEARFGAERVDVVQGEQATPVSHTRQDVYPPVTGGIEIRGSSGTYVQNNYKCSTGFVAQKYPYNYVITAGHCLENSGPNWYVPNSQVLRIGGETEESLFGGTNFDAGLIEISSSDSSRLVWVRASSFVGVARAQARADDFVGQKVCLSGINSSEPRCGEILRRDVTVQYPDGRLVNNQRKASFPSIGGDSGGSMYDGGTAMGIMASTGSTASFYGHIGYLRTYFPDVYVNT